MRIPERYRRVRPLGAQGLGLPYILDYKHGRLSPFRHPEWQRWRGAWVPAIWGGTGFAGLGMPPLHFGHLGTTTSTMGTLTLNTSYVYASAGNATGGRFRLPAGKTLNSIYFFINAYTGVAALVNDLEVELRNATSNLPGSTIHASQTKDPASATGWINASGLSFAMSANTDYFVSIADPDGGDAAGANAATNGLRITTGLDADGYITANRMAISSSNGWSTGTLVGNQAQIVLGFSDGTSFGQPFSSIAATTSNSNRRGLLIQALTEQLSIAGLYGNSAVSQLSGVELWSGTNGPSGSPTATGTVVLYGGGGSTTAGFLFSTPQTLAKATQYRLVFTYSGSTTIPRKLAIGTGADATLRAAMLGAGGMYFAGANGTTDWSNDDTSAWPQAAVLVEDQIAVAGGGGILAQSLMAGGG